MGLKEEFFERYGDREVYEIYRKEKEDMKSKNKKHKEEKKHKEKKDYKKSKHKDSKSKESKSKDKKKNKQRDLCDISVKEIKEAMYKGARTRQDLVDMLGICNECDSCRDKVDDVLNMACKCKKVTMQDVRMAMKDGANTVDKIMKKTGAGTKCKKCIKLLDNMVKQGY